MVTEARKKFMPPKMNPSVLCYCDDCDEFTGMTGEERISCACDVKCDLNKSDTGDELDPTMRLIVNDLGRKNGIEFDPNATVKEMTLEVLKKMLNL
jgi:hypothetical protein